MAIIIGTSAAEILNGTAVADQINGLAGNDILNGLAGNDTLDGGTGIDTLNAGLGNDVYIVDSALDVATELANQGTDLVRSSVTYTIGNNVENLTLTGVAAINATGNTLANVLTGNTSNNILNGGAGNDTMAGGAGNDTYVVNVAADVVTEAAAAGNDTVQAAFSYTLGLNVDNLTLTGAAAINGFGNTLANLLAGNNGSNILIGAGGNDTLNGGLGTDILIGGIGNDTYVANVAADVVVELAGAGTDTVQSTVTYTIGNNVENLTLTGVANINATGNALNNVLTGNTGNNILDGGGGNDTMAGGAGNDTYLVNVAGDVVDETLAGSSGTDLVLSSAAAYTLPTGVENLTLVDDTFPEVNGTGNGGDNVLTGNTVGNTLNGGGGLDTLEGGLGDDIYIMSGLDTQIGFDVVIEGLDAGTDRVELGFGTEYTLPENVENLTLFGIVESGTGNSLNNEIVGNASGTTLKGLNGNDLLYGDNSPDVLYGGTDSLTVGDGNDTLDGGGGDDTMSGGADDDTYIVDSAGDVVQESFGMGEQGFDHVLSSVSFTLPSFVEHLTLTGDGNLNGTGNGGGNVILGNSGNNELGGDAGNDTLDGGAGVDSMGGGAGNDVLVWNSLDLDFNIDGGADEDTLLLIQPSEQLDLTLLSNTLIEDVEIINLSGPMQGLTLAESDLLDLSSTSDTLQVNGTGGDFVTVTDGAWLDGGVVGDYHVYMLNTVTLRVDVDITNVTIVLT